MYIERLLKAHIVNAATKFPIIFISGPRQSGKTTLAKATFPDYAYINFELLEYRSFAEKDPHGFLEQFQGGVILDEVQHVPSLFSYLQHYTDSRKITGEYILTGSEQFSISQKITQSLAGRVAQFELLPLSSEELTMAKLLPSTWEKYAMTGSYPRIWEHDISPSQFYESYVQTYIDRDVRQLANIIHMSRFHNLLLLSAGRVGQELHYSQLATDVGVDQKTIKHWISILEASYIITLVRPYYKNFKKRIVKAPKLYFWDTALAAFLLGIRRQEDMLSHYARGNLFENLIVTELYKKRKNSGENQQLYYFRENKGNEVDIIIEHNPMNLEAIEIKSGKTFQESFTSGLAFFEKIAQVTVEKKVIYGGSERLLMNSAHVIPWDMNA